MKNLLTFIIFMSALLTFRSAFAQCDSGMTHEELVDCIVVEGSGENYSEWKIRFDTEYRESQRELQQVENQQENSQDNTSIATLD